MEKTNPVLKKTIRRLEEKGRKDDVDLWKEVARRLKRPRRKNKPVNLAKINRHVEDGETVLVPGKVTGYGNLEKSVSVAALGFSRDARDRIEEDGETKDILELLEENPKGENVRILEG